MVKMKLFEIFIPCLHGLGMENEQQKKKTNPNLQPNSLLGYMSGQWLAKEAGSRRPDFPPEHSWVLVLLLQLPDWMH